MFAGTTFARTGQAYDNKSGQWLGSLVASSGEDGTVMVGTTMMFDVILSDNFSDVYFSFSGMCSTLYLLCFYESSRSCGGLSYSKE